MKRMPWNGIFQLRLTSSKQNAMQACALQDFWRASRQKN